MGLLVSKAGSEIERGMAAEKFNVTCAVDGMPTEKYGK